MPAAWTGTPRDWDAGLLVNSTIANQEWRDRLMYLKDSPTFDGDVIVTGTLNVGSSVIVPSVFLSTTGIAVASNGQLTTDNATDATSTLTGSIQTDGGLGVVKALWVGGLANIAGAVTMQSTLNVTGTITGNLTGNVTGNTSGTADTVTNATQAAITTVANVTTVGALNAGSITSGFGAINIGTDALTAGSATVSASDGSITITGTGTGTGNFSTLLVASGTTQSNFQSYNQNWTTSGASVQAGALLNTGGAGGLSIAATNAAGVLRFYAAGSTEMARLTTGGDWVVGATAAVQNGRITTSFNGTTRAGITCDETANTSGGVFARFTLSGTEIGSITRNAATSAVLYNTSSDRRLKSAITPFSDALARVCQITAGEFTWLDSGLPGSGVIAQDLQPIYPDAVKVGQAPDESWAVDYGKLTPLLIGAVQELTARVQALEGVVQP